MLFFRHRRHTMPELVALVTACAAGLFLTGCGSAEDDPAQAPLDEAAAVAELENVQQRLSAVVQHKRDPRPLLEDARRLVERYPQFAAARMTYAQVLFLSGEQEPGYEQLQQALALDPAQAEGHVLAGSTAMRLERFDEAQRHFAQAVGLEPDNAKFRLMLANAQLRQNRHDEARRTLLQVIRLDSSLDAAYAAMSDLYQAQNKTALALDQIDRALALTPAEEASRREAYLRKKAGLLLRDNQPIEAMIALRELPPARLVDPTISRELSAIWMRLQQPDRAANHYEQILIINPTADWAAQQAAHYWLEAGQPEQARKNLAILRAINPRSPGLQELEAALRSREP